MAEKEDKFLKMRKEIMTFAERERKSNMSTMDFVDCILVNWFIPYKEQARKEEREKANHYEKAYNREYEENKRLRGFIESLESQTENWDSFCDCSVSEGLKDSDWDGCHDDDCMTIKIRKDEELLERKEGVDRSEM